MTGLTTAWSRREPAVQLSLNSVTSGGWLPLLTLGVSRMRRVLAIFALCTSLIASGCHPFWNPAGARGIRYQEFDTIYYQTSADRSKAFLFFSRPKRLIVGMSLSTTGDTNAVKYGVSFGGVTDTERHQQQYDTASLLHATRTNGLWIVQFDIASAMQGAPEREFWMFYESGDSPWGIRIPYEGTTTNR